MAKGKSTKFVFPLEFSKLAGSLSENVYEKVLSTTLKKSIPTTLKKIAKKTSA
jgi:hypothetical protein